MTTRPGAKYLRGSKLYQICFLSAPRAHFAGGRVLLSQDAGLFCRRVHYFVPRNFNSIDAKAPEVPGGNSATLADFKGKTLVLPDVRVLSDEEQSHLKQYVSGGWTLIITGHDATQLGGADGQSVLIGQCHSLSAMPREQIILRS